MRFRRRFRRSSRSDGTSLRWVASSNITAGALEVAAGGAVAFDLTPGAPSAPWQSGTAEPTLLRIRGYWSGLPRSAVSVADLGVREQRVIGCLIYFTGDSTVVLDPFAPIDLSNEAILYHGLQILDTRDFVISAGTGTEIQPFSVNVAGPGVIQNIVDSKAKRRVRNELDRLKISFRAREFYTQSSPPAPSGQADVSAMAYWALRFLYRTSR